MTVTLTNRPGRRSINVMHDCEAFEALPDEIDTELRGALRRDDIVDPDGTIRVNARIKPRHMGEIGPWELDRWENCPGSARPGRVFAGPRTGDGRQQYTVAECGNCHAKFTPAQLTDGQLPTHQARLTWRDAQRVVVHDLAVLAGFDPWSDTALDAGSTPESHRRTGWLDTALAYALRVLAHGIRHREKARLHAPRIDHGAIDAYDLAAGMPILSEAYLYPLVGKDAARTLLAAFHAFPDTTRPTLPAGTVGEAGARIVEIIAGCDLGDAHGLLIDTDDTRTLFESALATLFDRVADTLETRAIHRRARPLTLAALTAINDADGLPADVAVALRNALGED